MTHFLHYFTIRVTSNVGGLCRRLGWQRTEHTRVLPAPEPRVSEEPLSPAPDTSPLLSGQGATGHSVTVSGYCYTISCHQPHQQQQSGDQFTVKAQVLSSSGDPPRVFIQASFDDNLLVGVSIFHVDTYFDRSLIHRYPIHELVVYITSPRDDLMQLCYQKRCKFDR